MGLLSAPRPIARGRRVLGTAKLDVPNWASRPAGARSAADPFSGKASAAAMVLSPEAEVGAKTVGYRTARTLR
jgi:hypothetical protein